MCRYGTASYIHLKSTNKVGVKYDTRRGHILIINLLINKIVYLRTSAKEDKNQVRNSQNLQQNNMKKGLHNKMFNINKMTKIINSNY